MLLICDNETTFDKDDSLLNETFDIVDKMDNFNKDIRIKSTFRK